MIFFLRCETISKDTELINVKKLTWKRVLNESRKHFNHLLKKFLHEFVTPKITSLALLLIISTRALFHYSALISTSHVELKSPVSQGKSYFNGRFCFRTRWTYWLFSQKVVHTKDVVLWTNMRYTTRTLSLTYLFQPLYKSYKMVSNGKLQLSYFCII